MDEIEIKMLRTISLRGQLMKKDEVFRIKRNEANQLSKMGVAEAVSPDDRLAQPIRAQLVKPCSKCGRKKHD